MQATTDTEVLKSLPLEELTQASTFGALSTSAIEWLLQEGRITRISRGETLFRPDEKGDSFFVILDGAIAYYKTESDQYAYIRDYRKGQQIGFVSTIALHDRVGMAIATAESLLLEIDCSLFYRLHKEWPRDFGLLMLNLARDMARMIRQMDDVIVDMKAHRLISGDTTLE